MELVEKITKSQKGVSSLHKERYMLKMDK